MWHWLSIFRFEDPDLAHPITLKFRIDARETLGELIHQLWMETTWEDYNLASGEIRPAGGDVDGDGKDEIIVGVGPA